MGLTHNLTQNRKKSGGANGRNSAEKDILPETFGLESTRNACIQLLRAATDQKAGGSNPSRRARKTADSEVNIPNGTLCEAGVTSTAIGPSERNQTISSLGPIAFICIRDISDPAMIRRIDMLSYLIC